MKLLRWRNACYAFCSALACLIEPAGHDQSGLSSSGKIGQGLRIVAPHQYATESIEFGCGGIPYAGWEGCTSQTSSRLKSDDGATVYFVQDRYTSQGAANDGLSSRLKGIKGEGPQWQLIQTIPMDNVLLVELANPVQVAPDGSALSKWVYVWVEDNSLNMIYGPDREHVDEYLRIHQTDQKTHTIPRRLS